jgi:hypothetical protein
MKKHIKPITMLLIGIAIAEIANAQVTGSGTSGYLPKWSGTTSLTNSIIRDNGTNVGIGTAPSSRKLDVNGDINFNGSLYLGGSRVFDSGGNYLTIGNGAGAPRAECTFVGTNAGLASTSGSIANTFIGVSAGEWNTSGTWNTIVGNVAGLYNEVGSNNSIFGTMAGYGGLGNSSSNNSFFGCRSGYGITSGWYNTFMGASSGAQITTGSGNVCVGYTAGYNNSIGPYNTCVGYQAGKNNASGLNNSFFGFNSGYNSTGNYNTAIGDNAGLGNTSGSNNTFLGSGANAGTYTNATAIGNGAIVTASNMVRIGNASVSVVQGPVAYTWSDGRFKFNVKEEVAGLEFINKLRPR